MKGYLTCMGEILIDFLPIVEEGRVTGFSMHPGGAPFNVAVGLSRLGEATAFASKISTDMFGRFLRAYLESEGISTQWLLSSDAQTTLGFVSIEGGEPVFSFYGEGTADTTLSPGEVPARLFEDTAIFHYGSISLLRGATPHAVLACAKRLRGRALLSFDPNVRPGLIRDEAGYRSLLDQFFATADMIKLSAADTAWLMPDEPAESFLAYLQRLGTPLTVLTQGRRGVTAIKGAEVWRVPAFAVQVVDTVGAGDAFSAGFLASLADRDVTSRSALLNLPADQLRACLVFASAVSAITCTRPGANPPSRSEVEEFLAARPPTV